MTSDPDCKVTTFFRSNIVKTARLKDKLLLHIGNYILSYGMVLCLVTLTDLYTRREGLSASAELLVLMGADLLPTGRTTGRKV